MAEFTSAYLERFWRRLDIDSLAGTLFDIRNGVLFEDFPEYRITRDMDDPAHRAVYKALATYVINNFERKH